MEANELVFLFHNQSNQSDDPNDIAEESGDVSV